MSANKTTIFDFLNSINSKKKIKEYNKKDLSGYMLSLWLSHANDCIDIVNDINKHIFNIKDPNLIYEYYFDKIPKKKRFIKYIKGNKKKVSKDKLEVHDLSNRELNLYKDFF